MIILTISNFNLILAQDIKLLFKVLIFDYEQKFTYTLSELDNILQRLTKDYSLVQYPTYMQQNVMVMNNSEQFFVQFHSNCLLCQ